MKFFFLLTHVEEAWAKAPPEEAENVYQQYMELEREMRAQGKLIESVRLRTCKEAKSIHNLPGGQRKFVDGPYNNSKEVMGGFYVLECVSMEEAYEWAMRMPNYGHGSIEVRPVWE